MKTSKKKVKEGKMKTKKKDTIKKRVTSRLKGLGALVMALFLAVAALPFMPSMKAEAATGDQYWFIVYYGGESGMFCVGQESGEISGAVYEILEWRANNYDNKYVRDYSGFQLSFNSPLRSLGTLSSSGGEIITIAPQEDTTVNAGCVHDVSYSGALIQMKLDGTVVAETTGRGPSNSAKFQLKSGKYTVSCSDDGFSPRAAYSDGSYYKYIIEFKTVIESLAITPATATFTVGDDPQTLTVSPAAAASQVVWSSTDAGVATVDEAGKVTPVAAGTATIKATYTPEGGDPIVGTCEVKVDAAPVSDNGTVEVPAENTSDNGTVGISAENQAGNFSAGGLENSAGEIRDIVLTAEDKAAMAAGKNVDVWLAVKDNTAAVSEQDKALVESTVEQSLGNEYEVGNYLDLTLWKQVTGASASKVTDVPNGKVKVTMAVPEGMRKEGADYKVIRIHNSVANVLNADVDESTWKMSFETDGFSTYALAYTAAGNVEPDWLEPMRTKLHDAGEAGGNQTVEYSGDFSLPKEFMEYLKGHPQVTLVYHMSYEGKDYTFTIPGSKAIVEPATDWYGALWLNAHYGAGAASTGSGSSGAKNTGTATSPKTRDSFNGCSFWLLVMAAGTVVSAGMFLGSKKSRFKDQK